MNGSNCLPCAIIGIVLVCIAGLCLALLLGTGLVVTGDILPEMTRFPVDIDIFAQTSTPVVVRPDLATAVATRLPVPTRVPGETPQPVETPEVLSGEALTETLDTLENTLVPINDLLDLSKRLEGKENIPVTLEPPAAFYQVGDRKTFWVTNVDTNENFQVEAVLRQVTEHAYFWIEDGVSYNNSDLRALAQDFEQKTYPTNREFFGSEWTPGVDGDPHLYILFARGLGFNLLGYFSSADEFHPDAHEYSNAHEMFLLNADNLEVGDEDTYSTIAHEFQHMIHWYRDRNEESWMNEGFSVLAEFLNDYPVWFDWEFVSDPDVQLTDWSPDPGENGPHYGAGFMFVNYFLNRFGEDATKALVANEYNGMVSVEDVLAGFQIEDTLRDQAIGADDVFLDWIVATLLNDTSVGDGRYAYQNYPNAPAPSVTESFRSCPISLQTRDVHQYGADYISITCPGDYTLHFEGSTVVKVIPADPHSGAYAFWSNKGDESDMTLTQSFDFTDQSGPLTLSYWTWYDLEEDYDYLYLLASTDSETWEILRTPSCTEEDPSGNSYGCGYNGESGGGPRWIQEEVDISQFAGQEVQLRFEYITDAAVNGEGLLLDDISIPEIGYSTDFETDEGGWEAAGFVRIENLLPQTFQLALITKGRETTVQVIPVRADVAAEIPFEISGDVDEVILVVGGTTRFTRQKAAYQFSITP